MTKQKVISVILVAITLCGICFVFAGCEKNEAYITIACREVSEQGFALGPILEEWEFSSNKTEINIERQYDGKKYQYFLCWYNQYFGYGYSVYQDRWFLCSDDVQTKNKGLRKLEADNYVSVDYLCERGEYNYCVESIFRSIKDEYRNIKLTITVK